MCNCFQFVSDHATPQLVQDPAAREGSVCQAQHSVQSQATASSFRWYSQVNWFFSTWYISLFYWVKKQAVAVFIAFLNTIQHDRRERQFAPTSRHVLPTCSCKVFTFRSFVVPKIMLAERSVLLLLQSATETPT